MPRSSKALAVVEEFDENEGDFDADDGSDDWQPEPEVSFSSVQRLNMSMAFEYSHYQNLNFNSSRTTVRKASEV